MSKRILWASLLIAFVSGCGSEIPEPVDAPDPVCPGTRSARAEHASALGDTPDAVLQTEWGVRVVTTGAALIDLVDARCAE